MRRDLQKREIYRKERGLQKRGEIYRKGERFTEERFTGKRGLQKGGDIYRKEMGFQLTEQSADAKMISLSTKSFLINCGEFNSITSLAGVTRHINKSPLLTPA